MSGSDRMLVQQAHATAPPSSFIDPVPPTALSEANSKKCMDESSSRIRDHEWQSYIRERRRLYNAQRRPGDAPLHDTGDEAPHDLTGIALSGGGIRSATFALGVLQALAHHDLLRRFDYLSTVSGGGYIGTSLTWLTSKLVAARPGAGEAGSDEVGDWSEAPSLPATGFGLGPSDPETAFADLPPEKRPAPFPYGSEDPQSGREPDHAKATGALLRYLRQHSNYLMPGEGITPTSVVVVLLRLIILNLLVWIPILAAVMWSLIWLSVPHVPDTVIWVVPAPVTEFAPWAPTWLAEFVGDISPPLKSEVKAPASVAEPAGTISPPQLESPKLYSFGVMLATAIYLFLGCVLAFANYSLATWPGHKSSRSFLGGTKYGWRRLFERWMRVPFWTISVLLMLASVPFVAGEFRGWLLGPSFSLIGLASASLAFGSTLQHPKRSWIGAACLLYGILLISFLFGWWAAEGAPLLGIPPFAVLAAAFILAVVTGFAVNLNLISFHYFYRDRLMEAFLPDVDQALRNRMAPARQAELGHPVQHVRPQASGGPVPHHQCQHRAQQIQRKGISAARQRQLHPIAALLRQQRDWLAIHRTLHGRRADGADRDGHLGRARSSMAREWLDCRHPQPAGSECNGAHEPSIRLLGAEPE